MIPPPPDCPSGERRPISLVVSTKRRSVPEKADGDSPRTDEAPAARYHVPGAEEIRRTARRVLRSGRATYPSQTAFREAVVAALRRDDPLAVVGGARLRRLILETPGVRLSVHYTERPDMHPLLACPV